MMKDLGLKTRSMVAFATIFLELMRYLDPVGLKSYGRAVWWWPCKS